MGILFSSCEKTNISRQFAVISTAALISNMLLADARALACAFPAGLRGKNEGRPQCLWCPDWNYHSYFFSSSGNWAPQESLLISSTQRLFNLKVPPFYTLLGLWEWRERRDIQGVGCLPAYDQHSVLTSHLPGYIPLMASHEGFTQIFPLFFFYFFQLRTPPSLSEAPPGMGLEEEASSLS